MIIIIIIIRGPHLAIMYSHWSTITCSDATGKNLRLLYSIFDEILNIYWVSIDIHAFWKYVKSEVVLYLIMKLSCTW